MGTAFLVHAAFGSTAYNEDVNAGLAIWGPSLLVCLTVVLGILYNSSRISDLRTYIDARFNAQDKRFDDMKDFVKSEIRRLEDRLSPIHRA